MNISRVNLYSINFRQTNTKQPQGIEITSKPKKQKQKPDQKLERAIEKARKNQIYTLKDISEQLGRKQTDWFKEECFEYTTIKSEQSPKKSVKMIDVTLPINQRNLQTLQNAGSEVVSRTSLVKDRNLTLPEIAYLINSGCMDAFMLEGKADGTQIPSRLIDMSLEKNQHALETLVRKRSNLNKKLISSPSAPVFASKDELLRLGCGSEKSLNAAIGSGKLRANSKGQININDAENERVLRKLRSARCVDNKSAEEFYGISKGDFDRAVAAQNIPTLEALFVGDMNSISIDLAPAENRKLFQRLMFLTMAHAHIQQNRASQFFPRAMYLAWNLYPEGAKIVDELYQKYPQIKAALAKKEAFDAKNEKTRMYDDSEPQEIYDEEGDCEISIYAQHDREFIDRFDDELMQKIDFNEFRKCLSRASKIVNQYSREGIDSIKDKDIASLIRNYRHTKI